MDKSIYYMIRVADPQGNNYAWLERALVLSRVQWKETPFHSDAHPFASLGEVNRILKRTNIAKSLIEHGYILRVVRITKEVIQSTDESPLIQLAREAK